MLYVLIAVAGWRTWRLDRARWLTMLWWAQIALNFVWSPVFFFGFALGVILLLLITILGFIVTSWQQDRVAAALFVPYAAWVAFATLLNVSIFVLN